jgi:aldose 1-epimerase
MNTIATLAAGPLKIETWALGARLNGVWFQDQGNLTEGSASLDEALGPKKYNGAVVGPVANRIAGGKATLAGVAHTFETNENGISTLHSGTDGLHAQTWDIRARTETSVTFAVTLPAGLGGFPGNRTCLATYDLTETTLGLTFEAVTDAPTWMNLALHPYWRLSEQGRTGMRIAVGADTYLPVDDTKIPTGDQASVDSTIFDLRQLAKASGEIDHNLCLTPGDAAVTLTGDDGLRLEITTDAPGVQIYSGKPFGIAVEPQHWPDAMHHPSFPSIVLRPGQTYRQRSTYTFSRD